MMITITQIYQIGLNVLFLIILYLIIRLIAKKLVYDSSYKASYDALVRFEKDEQDKAVKAKVESVRNKYK